MEPVLLRVHSEDLQDHVAQEVGECLESGLYTDLMIRCQGGHTLHAHKLVLSAASPYIRALLENNDWEDVQTMELPDTEQEELTLLLEIVYNGSVEATIEDLKNLILLAHQLYITIPLSDELINTLELELPPRKPFVPVAPPKLKLRPLMKPAQPQKATIPVFKSKLPPPPLKMKLPLPSAVTEKNKLLPPSSLTQSPTGLKRLEHRCPICDTTYGSIGSFKLHMKSHDNDQYRDQRNELIGEIVANCHDPNTSLYNCSICNSAYNHAGNFKQHLFKHERETGTISAMLVERGIDPTRVTSPKKDSHLSKVLKSAITDRVVRVDSSTREAIHKCEQCGRSFNHAGNYKQHLMSHLRTANSPATPKRQMNELLAKQSSGKRPKLDSSSRSDLSNSFAVLTCTDCNMEFPNVDELEEHISFTHKQMEIDLDDMEPITLDESLVAEGLSNGYENNPVSWFPSPARKPGRPPTKNAVSGQKSNFKCEICGRVFQRRRKLAIHARIHTDPDVYYKFPCDICGKKFTRLQHVNRHKLTHSGDRPFHCPHCTTTFSREDKLKAHLNSGCGTNLVAGHEMDEDGNDEEAYDEDANDENANDEDGNDENANDENANDENDIDEDPLAGGDNGDYGDYDEENGEDVVENDENIYGDEDGQMSPSNILASN